MNDLILVAISVGGTLTLINVGWLRGYFKRRPKSIEAVCGCEHNYAFHDEHGCHELYKFKVYKEGVFKHYEERPCNCAKYYGPEPFTPYIVPPIAS